MVGLRATVWLAVLCSACAGDKDPEPVDSDTEVPETDLIVDSDDSEPPIETDEPVGLYVPPEVELATSGPIVCADPSLSMERRWDVRRSAPEPLTGEGSFHLKGGGVVLADLTGDHKLDVFMPGIRVHMMHVMEAGYLYVERYAERFPGINLDDSTGASVVDVDADGDLDLFVTRWLQPNLLLLNDGAGFFTDGTAASGIVGSRRSQTSSWGDMDRDGDLDLFVGNYGPRPDDAFVDPEDLELADPSQLWENLGDGTFADRSDRLPQVVHDSYTFMSGWLDLDNDGWTELLVVNDFGWSRPSRIFWNRPEGLVMDDGSAGFSAAFAGMGLGVSDLNGDGVLDFVQSSWRENSVLVSNFGVWFESSQLLGVVPDWEGARNQVYGWGTEVVDLENDGDDDILMNFGYWEDYGARRQQTDAVYTRDEEGNYVDRAPAWEMDDPGVSRGMAVGDLNDDGRVDVVKRVLDEGAPMYVSRCNENAWLRVRLHASAPNTHAIGAMVRVRDGGQQWTRPIHAGSTSMYSASEPEAHFGLADREEIEELEITWPGGQVSTLLRVPTRQVLDLTLR
jgi:hypothetical protein